MFFLSILAAAFFLLACRPQVFVQDDWCHLFQIQAKSFAEILSYFPLWQKNQIDPFSFYRPLSTKLYFWLGYRFFGLNVSGYLIVNVCLFLLLCFLFLQMAKKITRLRNRSSALFFFSFSLANFTYFSYLTKAEDLIAAVLVFSSILFWLKKKSKLSILFFLLSLASRENALIMPLLLAIWEVFLKKTGWKKLLKSLLPFLLISAGYVFLRTFVYGWPRDETIYHISLFGPHLIINLAKYLQWNLNLTGLLTEKTFSAAVNWLCFSSLVLISAFALKKLLKKRSQLSIVFFASAWWLISLLPVLFFAQHRDPWNLAVANAGMAFFLSFVFQTLKQKLKISFLFLYFLLFLLGLNFYRQRHWTVIRAKIVENSKEHVLSQCSQDFVLLEQTSSAEVKELQYAWYFELGPRVICQNPKLKVIYSLIN